MKVLFLSVTAGYGHHQAAHVLIEYLEERGAECRIIDTLEYINPLLGESLDKGYMASTKFTPGVYGKIYRYVDKEEGADYGRFSMVRITNSVLSKRIKTLLKDYDPDVIVCTHVFAARVMTEINRKGKYHKTIGIVTDFTIHPFWEDIDIDYLVTASRQLTYQATKKGIDEAKIIPAGIPIHRKFARRMDKISARELLGIENKTTILIMSGSTGFGRVTRNIKRLDRLDMDFQIISVCGNNKSLKQDIDNLELKKTIYNFGFVDNIDLLMDASDCIITKPGGLTSSEALAKGIPMILSRPIPGQEERNREFLLNNGAAMYISKTYHIDEAISQLFNSSSRLEGLKIGMSALARPNSTEDIGNFIIQFGQE